MPLASGHPVLIFDGRCGFCTWSVEWLRSRFAESVRLVPYQAIDPAQYGLTRAQVRDAVWWIDSGHGRHSGAAAVARALVACRRPWPYLGRLLALPLVRRLAAIGYALVARLRGHLPGVRPAWPDGTLARGVTVAAPEQG